MSKKISKMRAFGLIDVVSIVTHNKYANSYKITSKGVAILKALKSK